MPIYLTNVELQACYAEKASYISILKVKKHNQQPAPWKATILTGSMLSKISPCLWFDSQAEEAAKFYVSIFKDAKITQIQHYTDAGQEITGGTPGAVMLVVFELDGQSFTALNGGPLFKISEAISFQISCADQDEVDYYWEKLTEGGDPAKQQCGWLADKFGVSWQVTPAIVGEMMASKDKEKSRRAFLAMLEMKKIDIQTLERSFEA